MGAERGGSDRRGRVIAVVVTFNRLRLVRRTVECLRRCRELDAIVVVDNGSTDGTAQWLAGERGLTIVSQENVGGAGGFHTGIGKAYGMGAEWIWCMDDDVFPREDCLSELLTQTHDPSVGIVAPRRLVGGRVYTNDFTAYNLSNPFASMYVGKGGDRLATVPMEIAGTAFEGPLIGRRVVESIGLPNRGLFIFCDDTDYCLRATRAGFRIVYVPSALMDKHRFYHGDTWAERNRKKRWKRFYQMRNSAYLNHHYGQNAAVRHLRSFLGVLGQMALAAVTCPFTSAYEGGDVGRLWRAYRDGVGERLGLMHMEGDRETMNVREET